MSNHPENEVSRVPAEVGQAACGIVHDLANLIQTIILRAEVTSATEPISEACAKRMEQIVNDGQGGANLIRGLLEHARRTIERLDPADLRVPVNRTIEDLSASLSCKIDISVSDHPLMARLDPYQISDLVRLIFTELMRGTGENPSFSVTVSNAKPEGDVMNWMSEESWAELKIVRNGPGGSAELEEGHLHKSANGAPPSENVLNLMRIRGIVRQHRGQLRTIEEIEDTRQSYCVEVFIPLVSG